MNKDIKENNFFVMLSHPRCMPLIMTESRGDGDDIAYFKTHELAKEAAQDNELGLAFGYEVFCLGFGE